jgi:hypothetical protein
MMWLCFKTSLRRIFWTTTLAIIFSAVTLLSVQCLTLNIYESESQSGYQSVFARNVGPRGEAVTTLFIRDKNILVRVDHIEFTDGGVWDAGAFWSRDGTLVVLTDNKQINFAYDFVNKTTIPRGAAVKLVLGSRGGKGVTIFRNIDDFRSLSRYPWWWEASTFTFN